MAKASGGFEAIKWELLLKLVGPPQRIFDGPISGTDPSLKLFKANGAVTFQGTKRKKTYEAIFDPLHLALYQENGRYYVRATYTVVKPAGCRAAIRKRVGFLNFTVRTSSTPANPGGQLYEYKVRIKFPRGVPIHNSDDPAELIQSRSPVPTAIFKNAESAWVLLSDAFLITTAK